MIIDIVPFSLKHNLLDFMWFWNDLLWILLIDSDFLVWDGKKGNQRYSRGLSQILKCHWIRIKLNCFSHDIDFMDCEMAPLSRGG